MTDFELYSPQDKEAEFLVGVDDCIILEEAIRYYRHWRLECPHPDLSTIDTLDRFLAYLDDNPRFILSSYYDRITFDI